MYDPAVSFYTLCVSFRNVFEEMVIKGNHSFKKEKSEISI